MYWKMDLDYYTLPWLTLYVYLSLCILGRWALIAGRPSE